MQQNIKADLIQISEWLKINKSSLNVKKIHFMVFMDVNSLKPDIDLQTDGYIIEQTIKTKCLGVIIDCQLTWKYHINYISGKLRKAWV